MSYRSVSQYHEAALPVVVFTELKVVYHLVEFVTALYHRLLVADLYALEVDVQVPEGRRVVEYLTVGFQTVLLGYYISCALLDGLQQTHMPTGEIADAMKLTVQRHPEDMKLLLFLTNP